MAKKRSTRWFIVPKGAYTNEAIYRALGPDATEENYYPKKLCADGKRRDMWEVTHMIDTELGWSEHDLGFRYSTYYLHEGKEEPELWRFGKKQSKHIRDMQKRIEKLQR